jgi:acyl-CoA synthetase (AMP-forming)/AMP-acid ligase II
MIMEIVPPSSLLEVLRQRAAGVPESNAYTFLANGTIEAERLTYRELDTRARAIGAALQRSAAVGDRAVLLYPPGLEFIAALFGCFYAGVVAVPADPPRPNRASSRLRAIVQESRPAVALTTAPILARAGQLTLDIPQLADVQWQATETLPAEQAEAWRQADLAGDSPAFLQYTSGSTSDPRGVVVSHGNLLHNERLIAEACGHSAATVFVGWLPLYHDMGLVGNVLQPMYLGGRCILMAPSAFLQNPACWLQAISHYRATTSGGPNFAYDLCVRRIGAERRAGLDLSSWSVAFNGAEPIREETLERFAAAFAECGFRRRAFFPCYGLAEATLLVTGADGRRGPVTLAVQGAELASQRVALAGPGELRGRRLVSSGRPGTDQRVLIVDPLSRSPCHADEVGEIWVAGPGVASGYWNRPQETAAVFAATTSHGEGPFLRTGDLGFLSDGELFVTGRLKDLVIVRGQNHYPQDLERTAESCHPALLPGSSAAFAVEHEGGEQLVVVLERNPRRRDPVESVAPAVRWAVAAEHQIQVHAVVLVRAGTVPKTTSGKIRRSACRDLYASGGLEVLGSSVLDGQRESWSGEAPTRDALLALDPDGRRAVLNAFLKAEVGRILRLDPEAVDPRQPLAILGLDSLGALELEHGIGALQVSLPLDQLFDGASCEDLSAHLLDRLAAGGEAPAPLRAVNATEYPLSAMQKALWFEQQLAPQSSAYSVAFAARLESDVGVAALRCAFACLTERHPALRTTVALRDGEPVQRIAARQELAVVERDVAGEGTRDLVGAVAAEAHRPFDLERGPLFRVTLFSRPPVERVLLIAAHHVVIDGWSLWLLLDELRLLYAAVIAGRAADLPPLAAGYADFVHWQAELLASPAGERLGSFWQAELARETALDFPFDRERSPGQRHAGAAQPLRLGKELVRELSGLARRSGTTLYTILLGAYAVLLARYAGRQEVVVGSPVAGRSRPEFRRVVGCFFNTLPLRCELAGDPTFRALLDRLRVRVAAALEHQDYPSHLLAERLRPGRRSSGVPFFEAQFIFQQLHPLAASPAPLPYEQGELRLDLGSLTLDALWIEPRDARSPLELELVEAGDELIGHLRYSADLLEAGTAARLAEHFATLLREVAADADRPLSELNFLSPGDHELLLGSYSRTPGDYSAPLLVHELFAAQAARSPHKAAAVHQRRTITFAELDVQADQLADYLIGLER